MTPPDPFLALVATTIGAEGHYSNDPNDGGGETCWGMTAGEARAFGYTGPMIAMTRDQAIAIYRARFWVQPRFDLVHAIDGPIAARLFDIGVNMGQAVGGRFMQRALNALNEGSDYPALMIDGHLGAISLAALSAFVAKRGLPGRKVLLSMIVAQQTVDYIEITETSPKDKEYLFGWELQRALMPVLAQA